MQFSNKLDIKNIVVMDKSRKDEFQLIRSLLVANHKTFTSNTKEYIQTQYIKQFS